MENEGLILLLFFFASVLLFSKPTHEAFEQESFFRVTVLNCSRSHERKEFMKKILQNVGLSASFQTCIEKVPKSLLNKILTQRALNDSQKDFNKKGYLMTPGAAGLLSSFWIYLKGITPGESEGLPLYLEDDIIISPHWKQVLEKALVTLPHDWDLLFLGWDDEWKKHEDLSFLNKRVWKPTRIHGTQGVLINPVKIPRILSQIYPATYQLDTAIYKSDLNIYALNEPIVHHSLQFESLIQ